MLLRLLLAAACSASGFKSVPTGPKSVALPVLPAAAPIARMPSAAFSPVPRQVNMPNPASPLAQVTAAAQPQQQQKPAAALGSVFDGTGKAPQGAQPEVDLTALEPTAQLDASGFYQTVVERRSWASADEAGSLHLRFYRSLYRALAKLPPGHPYRSETPRGPVFYVGGSDVAQAILGLPRSVPDAEVNLHGKAATGEGLFELWRELELDRTGGADRVSINNESTHSLKKMAAARASAKEALDAVQDNILLKWHALALTPEGLEVRALDEASAEDLRAKRLRLSLRRGPLTDYELHYDLIVAYRALREAPAGWKLDADTRRLLAQSVMGLSGPELARTLTRVADALHSGGAPTKAEAVNRVLDFAKRELGAEPLRRLRGVAASLEPEQGRVAADEPRDKLARLAAPWRTEEQLDRLAREPRAPGETFRFAVIGDAEPGRFFFSRALFNKKGVFERALREAQAHPIDFTLQLGDMVSRGIRENFLRFFELLWRARPARPYLTVIGNHDRRSPHGVSDARLYTSLFGKTDYFFERGDWRIVVVDSSAGRLLPEQLAWLDRALDTDKKKLVFTHVPPAPLSAWTDWPGIKGAGGFKPGADAFVALMERRRVLRVYVGHIHAYGELDHNGVKYVLTGGGGSPLFPGPVRDKFHHYLIVEAGPGGVRHTIHKLD